MNIDEFLDSDKTVGRIGKNSILKIKYNENIEFIYKPSYGKFEYGNELNFLGFFEKITKKLYGSSLDFRSEYSKEMYSNFYESSIELIGKKLKDGANIYLNKYIEENKLQLTTIGKEIFDKYIATEWNYNNIQNNIIHDYIYNEQNKKMSFSINSNNYEKNTKELILRYVQNPIETAKEIFNEYINTTEEIESIYYGDSYHNISVKEYIGATLLENQFKDSLLQQLKNNPNNEYRKKRDIVQSIKDLDAQMITITLKHNNELINFKYHKRLLNNMEFYGSYIPDIKIRDKLEQLFTGTWGTKRDNLFIKEIVKIEYKKKVFYEDKELLNLDENISIKSEETHDIVEDMFD